MTYVKLTFENNGSVYTVYREWGKEKLKKGVVCEEKSSEAWLEYPDGRRVTKHRDVTSAVCDIVGLDRERFRRTVMIAQGEFRELLLTKTDKRMEILRSIFKTEIFAEFAEKAKEKHKDESTIAVTMRKNAADYAKMIETEDETLKALLDEVPYADKSALYLALEELNKKEEDSLNVISEEYAKETENLKRLNVLREKAYIDKKNELLKSDAVSNLAKAEDEFAAYTVEAAEAEKWSEKITSARESAVTYRSIIGRYDELESVNTELTRAESALELSQNEHKKCSLRLDAEKAKGEQLTTAVRETMSVIDTISEKEEALVKKEAELENKTARLNAITEYDTAKKILAVSEKEYSTAAAKMTLLKEKQTEKTRAYFDGIAGVLSSKLSDGIPCPVCGATHHPSPAVHDASSVTAEEIEEISVQCDEAARQAENAAVSVKYNRNEADRLEAVVKEYFGEIEDLTKITADVKSSLSALQDEIKALEKEISGKSAYEEKLKSDIEYLDRVNVLCEHDRAELEKITVELASITAAVNEKRERRIAISEKLPFATKELLEDKIEELTKEADGLEEKYNDIKKRLTDAEIEREAARAALETINEQLKNSIADKYDEYELSCKAGEASLKEKQTILIRETARVQRNRTGVEMLRESLDELEKVENKLKYLARISDTANGAVKGKDKIMLETFWQIRLFERIIRRANLRLLQMTDGRYELRRSQASADGRGKTGLELDIVDHYNTSVRSVRSLSGGESFAASLALALALSDETEAEAGGVRIDAIFIDEGFGSLDETSLEMALTVLEAQSGGRSVGIISHVGALKEKIDRGLNVTKQDGESKIQVR